MKERLINYRIKINDLQADRLQLIIAEDNALSLSSRYTLPVRESMCWKTTKSLLVHRKSGDDSGKLWTFNPQRTVVFMRLLVFKTGWISKLIRLLSSAKPYQIDSINGKLLKETCPNVASIKHNFVRSTKNEKEIQFKTLRALKDVKVLKWSMVWASQYGGFASSQCLAVLNFESHWGS